MRSRARSGFTRQPHFWRRVAVAFIGLALVIGVLEGFVLLAFNAMIRSTAGLP